MSKKPYVTTLVKDLEFQRKYNLTHTQTDVMAYLTNISNWAMNMGEGFYLLLHNKLEKDLGIGRKTQEATFTHLKKLGLIETKLVKVEKWDTNKLFRAVKLTDRGKEYDLTFYATPEIRELQEELKRLKREKEELEKELEKNNREEKSKNKKVVIPDISMLDKHFQGKEILLQDNEKNALVVFRVTCISNSKGDKIRVSLFNEKDKINTYAFDKDENGNTIYDITYQQASEFLHITRDNFLKYIVQKEFPKIQKYIGSILYLNKQKDKYLIKDILLSGKNKISVKLKSFDNEAEIIKEFPLTNKYTRRFFEENTITLENHIERKKKWQKDD